MKAGLALVAAVAVGCSGDPELATVSSPILEVTPAAYDFGDVLVGAASADQQVTASSGDGGDKEVTGLTYSCPGFEIDASGVTFPVTVNAAGTLVIPVRFAPVLPGAQSCLLTVNSPGLDLPVMLTGNGLPVPTDLTLVTPIDGALDFGDIALAGTSDPLTITVRNDGAGSVPITPSLAGGAPFALDDSAAVLLPAGEERSWQVTCAPTAAGPFTGSVVLASDDPLTISLACSGVATSLLVSPAPMHFDELLVGGSAVLDLEITNGGGGGEIVIASITSDAPAFTVDPPDDATLSGGESTRATVRFTPTEGGNITGTLTITYDGGASTRQVAVSGDARTALLVIAPAGVIDLGLVCVGDVSDPQTVTLGNGGTGAFDVLSIPAVLGGFHTDASTGTLDPGEEYPFDVTFGPVTLADEFDEVLTITTSIPDDPPHQVPVRATSIGSGVGASPDTADLGDVEVGTSSAERAIRITNCDAVARTVEGVTVVGDDAGAFALVPGTPTTGVDISSTETRAWSLEFAPGRVGPHAATLVFELDAGGSVEVELSGTGIGGAGERRGSYLACRASGDGGELGPLLLALGVLFGWRPRRRC